MEILTKIELADTSEVTSRNIAIAGIHKSQIPINSPQRLCLKKEYGFAFVWVRIQALRNEIFIGKVSQDSIEKNLGINQGDLIEFRLENIVNPCY